MRRPEYVRTSPSCDTGAVVVAPPRNAEVGITVPAHDGGIVALGLIVTGPVTVQAWVSGRYQGALTLSP